VNSKSTEVSMLTQHARKYDHEIDTENVKILDTIPNYHQRLIAESMHILRFQNALNHRRDKDRIHTSYHNLITKHKCK